MRMAGQMHTPTQSFNDSILETNLETPAFKLPPTNEKKLKEDIEHTKARLTDQRFNINDYPDPLLPRTSPREKFFPNDTTAETEQHLLEVAAAAKAKAART